LFHSHDLNSLANVEFRRPLEFDIALNVQVYLVFEDGVNFG
jgi:hypothetical protein